LKIAGQVLAVAALIPGPQQPFVMAAAAVVNVAAVLTAKKPVVSGQATTWRADPSAPGTITFGRTLVGGDIRYKKAHGKNNVYDTLVVVLSGCGPIQSIDATYADKKIVTFSGTAAQAPWLDRMWQASQLGLCPEAAQLSNGVGTPPDWTSAHKLSGYAAVMVTFTYYAKGDNPTTTLPAMGWLGHWVKGYDPREDSTYPGGSGTQRWDDETTWEWSENPFILALTYAIGWHQGAGNVRVGGVGMSIDAIDVAAFVEAANVADLNGWTAGGQVTTSDDKWETMKALCQAGSGEPVRYGAVLSCIVNTPKIPIATISLSDLIGEAAITTAQTRRERVNGIVPRYRSEDHYWEVVPASCIRNSTYLAEDGGKERTREVSYPLVQCVAGEQPAQAAQLAAYDIANAREASASLPLKLRWLGYRSGDCLTIEDTPEFGYLAGKDVLVMKRQLHAESGTVPLTVRTETAAKHAWALGQTGTAAPTTELPEPPELEAPEVSEWSLSGTTIDGDGSVIPALVFEGETDDGTPQAIRFSYYQGGTAPVDDADWILSASLPSSAEQHIVTSVGAGLPYMGSVQYAFDIGVSARLVLGPVTTGELLSGGEAGELLTVGGELLTLGGEFISLG
jgi:hypothetical protein